MAAIARDDDEKVRAIYNWITSNIAYDTDSYFRGIPGANGAVGVFSSGKSVCEGYSNLFLELAAGLDLEAVKIHGYAKGYGYKEFYFDTPPEQFIFSHYPEDLAFQLIGEPVSRSLFFKLPKLDGDDFVAG